jgi:hypothetical protein
VEIYLIRINRIFELRIFKKNYLLLKTNELTTMKKIFFLKSRFKKKKKKWEWDYIPRKNQL